MTTRLEDNYFSWLLEKVDEKQSSALLRRLHSFEFTWLIANDDNRAMDGIELRTLFLNETGKASDVYWESLGCSVLEMMVALCGRLSFETGHTSGWWFDRLLTNLGLSVFRRRAMNERAGAMIEDILHTLVFRLYEPNGDGGMFPLKHPDQDQRKVEIWYQQAAYVLENFD